MILNEFGHVVGIQEGSVGQGVDDFDSLELKEVGVRRIDGADAVFTHENQCANVEIEIADRVRKGIHLSLEQLPMPVAGG